MLGYAFFKKFSNQKNILQKKSWSYFNNQTYDENRISNENPFPQFLETNN